MTVMPCHLSQLLLYLHTSTVLATRQTEERIECFNKGIHLKHMLEFEQKPRHQTSQAMHTAGFYSQFYDEINLT